ncbi:MAG: uracil-DNA glycosylase [Pseudomonadota bacterium]
MTDRKDKIAEAASDVRNFLKYSAVLGVKEVRKKARTKSKDKAGALDKLRTEIGDCTLCKLCKARKNIVFGVGNPKAKLMFIGEGPGRDEDIQGIPFVGLAGQLLTKIIEAMGFKRDDVYIANIIKCRPPNNRNPEPDEVATCIPFLKKQVEIIKPSVIVCLGSVAAQNLLGTAVNISKLRGKFTEWQGIPVMPTYHPAFLLRNANMKKPVWEDMKKVMEKLKNDASNPSTPEHSTL